MNILINALAIQDSGGLRVLDKLLKECIEDKSSFYLVVCNRNENINLLIARYKDMTNLNFKFVESKGFLHRLYYENVNFRDIVKSKKINLIYNFSGTTQIFLKTPQLLKIQNLLFYTKKLDIVYKKNGKFIPWLKQIYFKRIVFNFMSNRANYLEVQSSHVENYMSDFIKTRGKTFFLKSDINVNDREFQKPKEYNFRKKIKFLYVVGPHFEYVHKNFIDFTNAMLALTKLDIDFEISITLTKKQLQESLIWNSLLNEKTNFLGYINDEEKMDKLFCDNTVLISTSVIETIGLHVIEAIKKGVLVIVPDERYSDSVYGNSIIKYELFDTKSLLNSIFSIIEDKIDINTNIVTLQSDLKSCENKKYKSVVEIFQRIVDVQK